MVHCVTVHALNVLGIYKHTIDKDRDFTGLLSFITCENEYKWDERHMWRLGWCTLEQPRGSTIS